MKKQNKMLSADNGISVSCRMCTKERVSLPILNDILLILLSMLTAVSAVMVFATVLNLRINADVVIPATMGFCAFYGILYKLIKKYKFLVIVGAALVAVLVYCVFVDDIIKGAVILYDQAMQILSEHMKWDAVIHTYEWQDSFLTLTNSVFIFLSFLLCSLISYFTVVKPSFIATLLLTFPFFEAGAAVGSAPDRMYFAMMLASWTASLTISRVANSKIKSRKANGKLKKQAVQGTRGKFAASATVIAAITLAIFLSSSLILEYIGISRGENVDELRKETKSVVSSVYDYITGEDNDGSLEEGNLLEVDDHRVKNRHYITMKTFFAEIPAQVKLKGYTASVYRNNRWEQIDNYDEYTELFEEFKKQGYNVGSLKGAIITSNPNFFSEYNFATVTLSNFRRKKDYVYETYYGSFGEEFTTNNDISVSHIAGNKDYTYATVFSSTEDVKRITESPLYNDDKFSALWKRYGEMVEKEYTSSFATEKVRELAESFNAKTKYQLVDEIRKYFKKELKYNFVVNKSPEDRDFVENFLFTTKSGYSTHFATAATVLLQSQGLPTRYVEGYFIPQKVFLEEEKDEQGAITIDVTDAYAHAWIEVYDSKIGWIPVEVTPGFWTGSFAEEMGEKDEKPSDTPAPPQEQPQEPLPEEEQGVTEDEPLPEEPPQEGDYIDRIELVGGRRASVWAFVLLGIVGLAVLAIAAMLIYHRVCNNIRRKNLYLKDKDTSINTAYKYFISLASYEGIECKNVYDFMNFVEKCTEKSSFINKESMLRFIDVYLKNTYSKDKATKDEAVVSADFVCVYSENIYRSLKGFERFKFKYIKNL